MAEDKTLSINATFSSDGSGTTDELNATIESLTRAAENLEDASGRAAAIAERDEFLQSKSIATGPTKGADSVGDPIKTEEVSEEVEETTDRFKRLNGALAYMQKVVTALNGTNGKVTKVTSALKRSVKLATDTISTFTNASGKATSAATASATATTASSTAAATATTVFGTLGTVAAGVTLVFAGIAAAAVSLGFIFGALGTALVAFTNKLNELAGNFSAALNVAKAAEKIAEIQRKMNSANRIGGELSVMTQESTGLKNELNELWTNMVDFFSPLLTGMLFSLKWILKGINLILSIMNWITEFIQENLIKLFDLLSNLKVVGGIFKTMRDWVARDRIKDAESVKALNKHVDDLFDPFNIGLDTSKRGRLAKGGFVRPFKP